MTGRLLLLGLNHTTAPLEVRERLSFNAQQQRDALAALRQRFDQTEAVLLSTCNRVELYIARPVHGHPRIEEMIEFLANFHSLDHAAFKPHLYDKSDAAVVEHLFTVASSLDSMVLGETQILGQVRQAYDLAREMTTTGSLLNPLFQRAIGVGKQVMTDTTLNEGRLSVASVAVDYARRIFDHFDDKTVLSIGAGKMAAMVLQSFAGLSPKRLLVCNRDPGKAQALAQRCGKGAEAAPFEQLAEHLVAADVVVSSTGASHPIITRKAFEGILKQRRYRPIFLIDIAMPRDIEPGVGEFESVYLYNLDDLQQVVSSTHAQRKDAIAAAQKIVGEQVKQYAISQRVREMGPVIDQLYRRYHDLAQEELNRTLTKLPNVSEAERSHLEDLTRRIVNKLLHDPVTTLRTSDSMHGPAQQYLHALEKLFQLPTDATTIKPNAGGEGDERSPGQ